MKNLIKMNYIWFLSFVIIGLFVYSTNNLYQSFSMQEEVDSSNLENNEESDNNIFNSLSRTLPNSNDGDLSDQNEDISNEEVIFDNFNTENSINEEESNTINTESEEQESGDILTESEEQESGDILTESEEQESGDILTESMNNDGNQETEIISENDGSYDIEMSPSNDDNNNDENENIDNTDNIGTN